MTSLGLEFGGGGGGEGGNAPLIPPLYVLWQQATLLSHSYTPIPMQAKGRVHSHFYREIFIGHSDA